MNQFCTKTLLHENFNTIKTRLLEVTEELKMRRKNDQENGLKFNNLITEKFEIKQQKDEEITNLKKQIDDLKQENLQLNKEFEEKMKMHEEDKSAQFMSINSSSKGIKSLKDEILALQLTKYGLEKKIKEQEHQLQMGVKVKDDISTKVTSLQKMVESVQEQHNNMRKRLEYLADLVVKTEEMQKKLVQVNAHHRCVLTDCQSSLSETQKELTATKAHVVLLSCRNNDIMPTDTTESNDGQIKELKALCEQLESDVTSAREQKKFLMSSLTESNGILSNLQSKFDDLCKKHGMCQSEIDDCRTVIKNIEAELDTKNKMIETLKGNIKSREENAVKQECDISKQIFSLQEKISIIQSKIQSVQHENRHFRDQHKMFLVQIQSLEMLQKKKENHQLKASRVEASKSNDCNQSDSIMLSRESNFKAIDRGETEEKVVPDAATLFSKGDVYDDAKLSNSRVNELCQYSNSLSVMLSNPESNNTHDGEFKLNNHCEGDVDGMNDGEEVYSGNAEMEESVAAMEE